MEAALIPRSLEFRQLIPALMTVCTKHNDPLQNCRRRSINIVVKTEVGSSWNGQLSWAAAVPSRAK